MAKAYGLDQVIMHDPYCVNAFQKHVTYLEQLDVERLLAGFYETAGLAMPTMRYGGWENMLIGGHTLGHYLTAVSQAYANAQCAPKHREILLDRIHRAIDGLMECQAHSKGKPGFVFGAVIKDPQNVELQFDLVEQNRTNIITEAWVPWYTMHKLLDGIVNVYRFTGYEPALTLGSGIGDWTYARAFAWSEETHRTVLGIEYGGMNDALYDLYQFTRKEEHLKAAHLFDEEALFRKIVSGEKNVLNNRLPRNAPIRCFRRLHRYDAPLPWSRIFRHIPGTAHRRLSDNGSMHRGISESWYWRDDYSERFSHRKRSFGTGPLHQKDALLLNALPFG